MDRPLFMPALLAATALGGGSMIEPPQFTYGNWRTKARTGVRQYNSSFEKTVREAQVKFARSKQSRKDRRRAYTGGR